MLNNGAFCTKITITGFNLFSTGNLEHQQNNTQMISTHNYNEMRRKTAVSIWTEFSFSLKTRPELPTGSHSVFTKLHNRRLQNSMHD